MERDRRVITIGDVHGCHVELQELLALLKHDPQNDRLILAGDLVDRGPDSHASVQLAIKVKAEYVIGNHCEKHIRYRNYERRRVSTGAKNPMQPFHPTRMAEHRSLTTDDFDYLEAGSAVLEIPGWGWAVHGGLMPFVPPLKQELRQVCRLRHVNPGNGGYLSGDDPRDVPVGSVPWQKAWNGPGHVVYGHAVFDLKDPRIDTSADGKWKCYGIDTGCVFGGVLTALVLMPDAEVPTFVSVPAKKTYFEDRRRGREE